MPPRIVVAAIIVFWLATTSVLVYRELAPRFQAGAAPPFTIDLTSEVGANIVNWNMYQKGQRVGSGFTQVRRQPDRTFEFYAQFKLDRFKAFAEAQNVKIVGSYRVTEEGKLLAGSATINATVTLTEPVTVEVVFEGEVREQMFHPKLAVRVGGLDITPPQLVPFPVSDSGSILNPMHLVHKISGLRDGQSWLIPLMDPLRAVPGALGEMAPIKSSVVQHVVATVAIDELEWLDTKVSCFRIDYAKPNERPLAKTWVRRRDSVVLQQWAGYEGIEYTLQRAPGQ